MTAPIALFVYNRPEHTRRTIEALAANALARDSELFVYADAPRDGAAAAKVAEVRALVRAIDGFRSVTVVERELNMGVDASVIDGVTTLCERFGEVIVLEDDLVTSPWFLQYMNDGLDRYRQAWRVMQVAGFMFPLPVADIRAASLLPYATSWGWATWKRAWTMLDASAALYGRLKSNARMKKAFNLDNAYDYFGLLERRMQGGTTAWDICWYSTVFANGGLAVFPQKTLVENIGFDGSGVHSTHSDRIACQLNVNRIERFPSVEIDERVWRSLKRVLKSMRSVPPLHLSILRRLVPLRIRAAVNR